VIILKNIHSLQKLDKMGLESREGPVAVGAGISPLNFRIRLGGFMKIKLVHKLFASLLCTSLLIVISMVATTEFYVSRNFADYVNKMEMERLSSLIARFGEEYAEYQGWDHLKNNSKAWRNLLRSGARHNDPEMPPMPPPPLHEGEPPMREPYPGMPEPGPHWQGGPMPPPPQAPFLPSPSVSLFDAHQRLVVGNPSAPQNQLLQAITVDGKTVGWLGVRKSAPLSHPLDVEFAEQQTKAFYLIGIATLCAAILVSFFLSRHLLRPIKQLTAGTQALSQRQFETRITIHSRDELGQLASDFNAMAQALEKYEHLRRQWLSDISHELRTPLSILRAEIEAMQDGVRTITEEALASLHSEVLHLSKIVDDLHELSSAESGMLAIKRDPVNPLQVLKATLKSFETRFKERDLHLQEDLESTDITVAGDEDRLRQLFSNILENTLRYADAPGTLKVWHHHTDEEVTLNFLDSGPGVPEKSLEHLFDRLYRVDEARNREHGGSGLGLAICKSIVEALGGRIKAANAPSAGLWIEMVFPLLPPKDMTKDQTP
jgi:two-component system, OmpR family, sensor histidine kinase BaeS